MCNLFSEHLTCGYDHDCSHGYNNINLDAIAVHKCGHKHNCLLVAVVTPVLANLIMLVLIHYNNTQVGASALPTPEDEQGQFSRKWGSSDSHFGVLGVEVIDGHLRTVSKKLLASICHSGKLGSAQVQHQFSTGSAQFSRLNLY